MGRTRSTTDALGSRTVYELDTLDRMTAANDRRTRPSPAVLTPAAT
jgi:hypothetical protein